MNKTIIKSIACRETVVEDGARWFQTFPPFGRYPAEGAGGLGKVKPGCEFVFDEASAKAVIDDFRAQREANPDWPGILVDREHFSLDPAKSSDAMAWAVDIRQAADGSIWTKWTFTPEGQKLWDEKILVNRSPCFSCSESKDGLELRPLSLISIGMTNTPFFSNLSALAAARAAEATNPEKGKLMEKLLEALGLAADASEDEALAAVNALKEKASAAEVKATDAEKACEEATKKADEAEAACRALKADAFIAAHKDQITDVAACREAYIAAPEATEKAFALCKAAPVIEPQQVLAAAKAVPEKKNDVMTGLAACKSAAERVDFVVKHAAEIAAANK